MTPRRFISFARMLSTSRQLSPMRIVPAVFPATRAGADTSRIRSPRNEVRFRLVPPLSFTLHGFPTREGSVCARKTPLSSTRAV